MIDRVCGSIRDRYSKNEANTEKETERDPERDLLKQ